MKSCDVISKAKVFQMLAVTVHEKVCSACKQVGNISQFKRKTRIYKRCSDCRRKNYQRCKKCGALKRYSRIINGEPFNNICEKCKADCVKKQDEILTEALNKIDGLYWGKDH